jgi:alpha-beta hydrolase superfamily lysophospholipase
MNRRTILIGGAAGLTAHTIDAGAQSCGASAQGPRQSRMPHLMFGDDPQFWFETLRVIGAADYGGAQFGEAMMTASRIRSGDYDGWHDQWKATADAVAAEAQASLRASRRVSARDGFLRASNYYRNAEFFLHANPADPRMRHAYEQSVACFRQAAALFDSPVEAVEVPYARTTLPGYFYRADASPAQRPLIVMHNGFDGSVEEMHFLGAQAAVERGYNVLAFDGPGQFGPLHREGLTFRPDWEKVVAPVLDYALTRSSDVDPARIALMGVSMGGLLAPRAAAFERRLSACIANDGIYDYGAAQLAAVPPAYREEFKRRLRAERDEEIDQMLARIMASNPTVRWAFTHGMYAMGAPTPRRYMAASLDYTLAGGIAEAIACPTLVCEAEDDIFFTDQPQQLYEHLTCPKTLLRFTAAEGAGAHCQVSASRLAFGRIYDWLDGIFGR